MDYYTKLFKYRTAGVREYWIIDAAKNQIFVYNFEKGDAEQYTLQDSVKAGIYENLVIDFSKLDIEKMYVRAGLFCSLPFLKFVQ